MSLLMDALKQAESAKRDNTAESPAPTRATAAAVAPHPSAELTLAPLGESRPLSDTDSSAAFAAVLLQQAEHTAHKFETAPTLGQPIQTTDPIPEPVADSTPAPSVNEPERVPELTLAPTPVHINTGADAASRIIAASASRQTAQRRRTLFGNIGLGLILAIAIGSYYFYATLEQLPPHLAMPQPAVAVDGSTQPASDAVPAVEVVASAETGVAQGTPLQEAPSAVVTKPAPAAAVVTAAPVITEMPQQTPAQPAVRAAPVAHEDYVDMGSTSIQITRSAPQDSGLAELQSAYAAYRMGHWEMAERGYQNVLAQQPGNRDAHLGLAALAVRAHNYPAARQHYRALLRANPRDTTAHAALADLSESGSGYSESELKSMLAEDPQAAQLHFALANVYAGQQRWEYAQQAYFDAQRLAADNPDYAFNLAVSLEHLGQSRSALEYYRRAVQLAQRLPAQFAIASAQQRIDVLSASGKQ